MRQWEGFMRRLMASPPLPPLVLLPPAALHELSVPACWSPVQLAEQQWASLSCSTSPFGEA